MKLSLTLATFSITAVLAGPQLNRRDIPKCEDGEDPTSQKLFNTARECEKGCFLREQMRNSNYLKTCRGRCEYIEYKSPKNKCNGRDHEALYPDKMMEGLMDVMAPENDTTGLSCWSSGESGADVVFAMPILLAPRLSLTLAERQHSTTATKLNSELLDDMLLRLPFIATLLSIVSTQRIGGPGNATVRFFTDKQDCESSDTKSPVLTTRDTPTELICFNLTDTFSPGNKTISGYQKALRPWQDRTSNISFYHQQNDFEPSANYTQIRYELPGGDVGEKSSWVLWVYPHLNCDTEVKGVDNHEYPWFEVDCQTKDNGECQEVNYPIKSFAILNGDRNGNCKTWAQLGAATKTSSQITKLFHTTVAMAIMSAVL